MIEILVAGGLLAGIIMAFGGQHGAATDQAVVLPTGHLPADDLPCPWCGGDTREDDAYCPSCRQPFG